MSIDDIPFNIRTLNILKYSGISSIEDLASFRRSDLLRIPNCGRKTINEIQEAMARYGVSFQDEPTFVDPRIPIQKDDILHTLKSLQRVVGKLGAQMERFLNEQEGTGRANS